MQIAHASERIMRDRAVAEIQLVLDVSHGASFITPLQKSRQIGKIVAESGIVPLSLGRIPSGEERQALRPRLNHWALLELLKKRKRRRKH